MQPKPLIWLDANISPAIALWLNDNFEFECKSCYILNLHKEKDITIYQLAKEANVIFITKNRDFVELQAIHKVPPKIILLNSGNVRNADLKNILQKTIQKAIDLLLHPGFEIIHIS
jgi:predicted nuclease of predicted toxin-antitoxin system